MRFLNLKFKIMKRIVLFSVMLSVILFTSCEKIKDATAIDIDTELTANIPVNSDDIVAIQLKSQKLPNDVYEFGGSSTFSLADNPDIEEYLGNIRDMTVAGGSVLTFLGATEGNEILTCQFNFDNKLFEIPESILTDNGVIEYMIDSWTGTIINMIEANPEAVYALQISGTANYDIETTVRLKIPVTVAASPL